MSCEWTTSELAYLREAAGRVPLREIQLHLRRSAESVRKQAQSQGLSLRVPAWRMEWCDECATWRMRLRKNALCGVVRYPNATTYNAGGNPFFGGNGCCGGYGTAFAA